MNHVLRVPTSVSSALIKSSLACLLLVSLLAAPAVAQDQQQDEAGSPAAQDTTIEGVVRSSSGKPMEGVLVKLAENPSVQAVSDENGMFSIAGTPGQDVLVSTPQRHLKTVHIQGESLRITLEESDKMVPLGYDRMRSRREVTGAIDVADDFSNQEGVTDPSKLLYGQLSGLTVLQNGGNIPNNGGFSTPLDQPTSMFIRGVGTFRDNAPVVLVDGFERPLSSLAKEEIESISVLKDAGALAMYGVRGANGIIMVNTKRGETEGFEVNASIGTEFTEPAQEHPEFLGSADYARALNEARINDGEAPRYTQADIENFSSGAHPTLYPNVNWFDEVLRDQGNKSRYNISFNGGNSFARYFGLVNYQSEAGLYGLESPTSEYSSQLQRQKFRFRTNLDVDITDNVLFKFNFDGGLSQGNTSEPGNALFNTLYSLPSAAYPIKTSNGIWGGRNGFAANPVASLKAQGWGRPNYRDLDLKGTLDFDLGNWLEGLSAAATVAYFNGQSNWENRRRNWLSESQDAVLGGADGATIVDTAVAQYGRNSPFDYNSGFNGQNRKSDVLGKVKYESGFYDRGEIEVLGLFHQEGTILRGQNQVFHRRNFAGNVHAGWDNTYFVDLALSYSGNNHFSSNERYTFFPAISAAWLLSEESFLQEASWLDYLKLRASWGRTGNDRGVPTTNPDKVNYGAIYGSNVGYNFGSANNFTRGYGEGRIPTDALGPEIANMMDAGVSATLFSNLSLSADLFYERRTNILSYTGGEYSEVLGTLPPRNTEGIVENRGVELAMGWDHKVGDFSYNLGGQFSFTQNEVVEQGEQYRPYPYLRRTGEQVGQAFGLEVLGFFEDQADIENSPDQEFTDDVQPGDIKYKDQNGDGIINQYDEVALGQSTQYPEMYFSGTLGAEYKGIGLSAIFQGVGNYSAYRDTRGVYQPLMNNSNISSYYYENRWRPNSAGDAKFPRLTANSNPNNYRANSLWLVDRSYLKLRSLKLSYSLSPSLIQNWGVEKAQIYVQGRNLFSIDGLTMRDPEQIEAGYPLVRMYGLGINLRF